MDVLAHCERAWLWRRRSDGAIGVLLEPPHERLYDSADHEIVEVVPAATPRGAVSALERIADLDDEYGEETAAGAIAADALVDLGVRQPRGGQ